MRQEISWIQLRRWEMANRSRERLIWFKLNFPSGKALFHNFIKKLQYYEKYNYINWVLTRYLREQKCIDYALFAVQKGLPLFEKECPGDKTVEKVIAAIKDYLDGKKSKTGIEKILKDLWKIVREMRYSSSIGVLYAAGRAAQCTIETDKANMPYLAYEAAWAIIEVSNAPTAIAKQIVEYGFSLSEMLKEQFEMALI